MMTHDTSIQLGAAATRAFVDNPALMLRAEGVRKTFTLHGQGGITIDALSGISLNVERGECVVLAGPSGAGKSSFLRCLYGNYLASGGSIAIRDDDAPLQHLEITTAEPHAILRLRRNVVGYVSQFLRVIPRVTTLDLVAAPLTLRGVAEDEARERASSLLARLNVPQRLWSLAPATFSGGEQQRVNIARGFVTELPLLLLDEPTTSLDPRNRELVVELIREQLARGVGMLGIFHDLDVRSAVGSRAIDVEAFEAGLARV
ncbi:MAG TPA: phosphonate C-P lyase system protein PhnL, partial [Paraburkholderia sp.]